MFLETAEDLNEKKARIKEIIKQEEERFIETLETGSARLDQLVHQSKKAKSKTVHGGEVFKLYDTYGFPPELTKEILSEQKLSFNQTEFDSAQSEAQSLAREGWKGSGAMDTAFYNQVLKKTGPSKFKGYETLSVQAPIKAILVEGQSQDQLKSGRQGEILTDQTPFYPEGGGQVGDRGWIKSKDGKETLGDVLDAQKPINNLIVHFVQAHKTLKVGDIVGFHVNPDHREPTKRHHTATHLLHAALRKILGSTVTQAGSLVAPDRLRFDYTYNKPLSEDQIKKIEDMVNGAILQNMEVQPKVFPVKEAKKMGAMALFGEKYGEEVRCLLVSHKGYPEIAEAFSLELCGGTHVSASGDIGGFKIVSDTSLSAGVRRMEALAGFKTIHYLRDLESKIKFISSQLKSSPNQVSDKIQRLLERQKQLEQEVRELKLKAAQGGGTSSNALETQQVNGINLAIKINKNLEVKELRILADRLKQQVKSGVIFVASTQKDEDREKVSFVVAVTADLNKKGLNAGKIAKSAAFELGGSGGGRPDFAQGGGQGLDKLDSLIKKIPELIG